MQSFLQETVNHLLHKETPISEYILIVPSKRAAGFLQKILVETVSQNIFAPTILSIEEFVSNIAGIQMMPKTELLLESHKVYQQLKEEPLETYLGWAETILNDFSEIDRHLVPPDQFFDYLSSIKLLEKWGIAEEETPMIKEYFSFWTTLFEFYTSLTNHLLNLQKGYQGLVYRKATEELEFYIEQHQHIPHAFIGFNALNKAEQTIIQELLEQGNTTVYWDMDAYYVNDPLQSAGHFFRSYLKNWKYFQQHQPPVFPSHYETKKNIEVIQATSDIAQVKYVGQLLGALPKEQVAKTAVVLADEALLIPLLYSLPKALTEVNITMGYPLRSMPSAQFFLQWLEFLALGGKTIYYKTFQKLLSHPVGQRLVPKASKLMAHLAATNKTHLTPQDITAACDEFQMEGLQTLFESPADVSSTISKALHILHLLENKPAEEWDRMVFRKVADLFLEMQALQKNHTLTSQAALKSLFELLLDSESLDFQGDAYNGLQVMGMLETRVLDFEHIILLSVNEGTLPTGKTSASFLTYDLKKEFNLPLPTEKDAVYAYHFFRLLQRAKDVTLVYNGTSKGLTSGEQSRFIRQVLVDALPQHTLEEKNLYQDVQFPEKQLKAFKKNDLVMARIEEIALKGFSPSALTSYVRNPAEFYYQRILKIQEVEEVEETVAYNTLGTIVHETLEVLYQPFLNTELREVDLTKMIPQIPERIDAMFVKHFHMGDFRKGKNLIIYEVAKRYVENLIRWDLEAVTNGQTIELLALEKKLTIPVAVDGIPFPVHLNGTVDRMDRQNGVLRIIDYKTGRVNPAKLKLSEWELLLEDYDYSKAFQVLTYAYMLQKEKPFTQAEAGIVSFKSMKEGFMKFQLKELKEAVVNADILNAFEEVLFTLIKEICNPEVAFVEKEIPEKSW